MELEIPEPKTDGGMLTSQDVTSGEPIAPLTRLKVLDADRWEDVTLELVHYWKTKYSKVVRCGGGGDMGRDVIAYSKTKPNRWENFQCKYYGKKLNLSQALLEIGKLLFYAYEDKFSLPEKYYFVTPLGVSTDLLNHLMDSEKLKSELLSRWDKVCRSKITSKPKDNIELTDGFRAFIETVSFDIFDHIPPLKIIELHANTPYHTALFGVITKKRPPLAHPPKLLADIEITYTTELVKAFGDAEGKEVNIQDSSCKSDYKEEYDNSRKNFYAAEGLEKFSRDWLPNNSYQELIDECYEAISSTIKRSFINGYQRYLSTTEQAATITYSSHPLNQHIKIQDKKGMCHQLVNANRVSWIRKDSVDD